MDGGVVRQFTRAQAIVEEEMGRCYDFNTVRLRVAERLRSLGVFSLGVDRVERNGRYTVEVSYRDSQGEVRIERFLETSGLTHRYGDADHWGR